MANAEFGYISPPPNGAGSANEYMDAETTERVVNGVNVKIQRIVDRVVEAALYDFRDRFNTRDLATSAGQDAILTELQRKANSSDALLARPTLEVRQRQGLAFMASSGRVQLTAGGNFRATIRNPTTHTRTMYLARLAIFVSQGPTYAHLFVNPTTGLPTSVLRPVNNSRIGSTTTSPAEIRVDTDALNALGGGIDTGIDLALPVGRSVIELAPLSIPPNVTLGLNAPFAGASDVVMTAYFYEES